MDYFTDEELDFIINYDIKYRMGLHSGGDVEGEDGDWDKIFDAGGAGLPARFAFRQDIHPARNYRVYWKSWAVEGEEGGAFLFGQMSRSWDY